MGKMFRKVCRCNTMRGLIHLLTILLFLALAFSTKCHPSYQQNNFVLRSNILVSLKVQHQQECTTKCSSYFGCFSVNYYHKKKMCELNKANHLSSPVDLVYDEEGTYIRVNDQDVCSDRYCSTGKICLPNKASNGEICKECSSALGMKSGKIPNSAITASTLWGSGHEPWRARLDNYPAMPYNAGKDMAAWAAKTNQVGEYLQVNLGGITYVTMVATQGRPYAGVQYVTKYKLSYKNSNNIFVEYPVNGVVKVFQANTDVNTIVTHRLPEKMKTQYIRFVAMEWVGHISMRVEVYGCPVP